MQGQAADRATDRKGRYRQYFADEWLVRHVAIVVLALTLARLAASGLADLAPDETYYWLWSRHLAFGYLDHPPMVAWSIALTTLLMGFSALVIRLPFVVMSAVVCWIAAVTARRLYGDAAIARRTALWLSASALISVGGILATPDVPSVFFWTAATYALARVDGSGDGRWWLLFGLLAGLGIEAKYTNLFLGPGVLVWFAFDARARRWLATPWPWAAAGVAVAAIAPNIVWNLLHDNATILKQFGRIDAHQWQLTFLPEFLFGQIGLINPFTCGFAALAFWRLARRGPDGATDRASRMLLALALPLILYMAVHVFHDRVQANWPAPIYPALITLAAAEAERSGIIAQRTAGGRLARLAAPFGLGLGLVGLCYISLPAPWFRSITDPAQILRGWDDLASQIEETAKAEKAAFVAPLDYTVTAELDYHLYGRLTVVSFSERERYPWHPQAADRPLVGEKAIIITEPDAAIDPGHCFDRLRLIGPIERPVDFGAQRAFVLYSGILREAGCALP